MNEFLQTDFANADGFGKGSVNVEGVLRIFCAHPHMDTRNACLQILRSTIQTGEGHRMFLYGSHDEAYALLEFTIKGLNLGPAPATYHGTSARHHQDFWYEDGRKILMEVYLALAAGNINNAFDRRKPITFLFELVKSGKSPFSPPKTLKHVLYHTNQLFFYYRDKKHELEGLEEFLTGYLHRQVENLCGEKLLTDDDWEPVRKIIEFIVGHKYYKTSLHVELERMKKLLWEERRKQGKMSEMGFDKATQSCLYEQAISLLDYVIHLHIRNT